MQIYTLNESGEIVAAPDGMVINDLTKAKIFDVMPAGTVHIPVIIRTPDGSRPWVAMVAPSVILTIDQVSRVIVDRVDEARQGLVDANNATNRRQDDLLETLQEIALAIQQIDQKQDADIDMLQSHSSALESHADSIEKMLTGLTAANTKIQATQATLAAQQSSITTILEQLAARKAPIPLPDVVVPASTLIALAAGPKTIANLSCVGIKTSDTLAISAKSFATGYGILGYSIPAADKITLTLQCPLLAVGGTAQTVAVTAFR